MQKIFISAALAFAALQPATAQAQTGERYIVTIPVRGLDLASPAGADILRRRAARLAEATCGEPRDLEGFVAARKCRKEFMSKIETRIAYQAAQSRYALARR